ERVVYGSGDDALLTELFGVDSPYSEQAEEKRRRLARLESAVLRGTATPEEVSEHEDLQRTLTSSFTALLAGVAGRINPARRYPQPPGEAARTSTSPAGQGHRRAPDGWARS